MATRTKHELSQELSAIRSRAASLLAEVRRTATAAEQARIPVYGETVPAFEARQHRAAAAALDAEAEADRWLLGAQQAKHAIQEQLEGPSGWGLDAAGWSAVGNLGGIASSVMIDGPLSGALAELRSAIRAGDRSRAAAFAMSAETRLRSSQQTRPASEGRISTVRSQDAQELRSLIADARRLCEDRSLDDVRAMLRETTGAVGTLGAAVYKARASRKPIETFDGRPKVRWPERDENGRLVHPDTGEDWAAWSARTEAEKRAAQRGSEREVAVPVEVQADGSLRPVAPAKAS